MFNNKKVLVTGGTGMIGQYLVELLLEEGAKVRVVSLDDPKRANPNTEFMPLNLLDINNCIKACEDMDIVFHLAGIKGSPAMTKEKPASFFVPTMLFNINMMEAARKAGVGKYLFTSSIGVYHPDKVLKEEAVWQTFPSVNDKFAGWAKRMGELQAQAYHIEYNWHNISIVRPANVYGRYDNFDPNNAMVIPSLIHKVLNSDKELVVWGDGLAIRDFIHAKDVARGMLFAIEQGINEPINLGSGSGVSIKEIVKIIMEHSGEGLQVIWDTTKPSGDKKRILDMSKANHLGYKTQMSLKDGIIDTIEWYKNNQYIATKRFNVFNDGIQI